MSLRVQNINFENSLKPNSLLSAQSQNLPVTVPKSPQSQVPATVQENIVPNIDKQSNNFIKDNLSTINSALAIVSLGIGTYALVKNFNSKQISELSSKFGTKMEELGAKLSETAESLVKTSEKINGLNDDVTKTAKSVQNAVNAHEAFVQKYSEKVEYYDNHFTSIDEKINSIPKMQTDGNGIFERNSIYVDGIKLIRNLSNDGSPIKLPDKVLKYLENVANTFIYNGKNHAEIKPLNKNSTIWSITAESIPEKEGGLGEVPVQIAKNLVSKDFNINNYIVRPLVQWPQKSQLLERSGQQTIYRYNINADKPFEMAVDKVAEFNMNVMRNGKFETQKIEVYTGIDPEFKHKRLMFKNDDYFSANGIYKPTCKVSEPERFAMFDKAVYEFMKIKADPNSATHLKICDVDKFNDISVPDAMILNDWHAGGLAGLLRLKAPCEAAMNELSNKTANKFKEMNLVNIVHNLDYQGYGGSHSEDILATLFDKYSYDIYKHANTPFGYDGIQKVLTVNGNSNLANMGLCLSNIIKPVSPTYAKELAVESARSRAMQHLCKVRLDQGTMRGASNGWDRELNEISPALETKFFNFINADKIKIIKDKFLGLGGLDESVNARLNAIIKDKHADASHLDATLESLVNLKSPLVSSLVNEIRSSDLSALRQLKTYTHNDTLDNIMLCRKHNKRMFLEQLNNMIEYQKSRGNNLFELGYVEKTDFTKIKPEELDDTIVFNMGVRFVSQKGVDVAADAIKKVLTQWESHHPNKPLPVFVVGGVDAENGAIKAYVRDLKQTLDPKFSSRVLWQDGFTCNPLWQAGSDYTLFASHFEPDGAKWESLYKGTPVICTRVGGHVDSVNDGVNGFLTARTVPEIKQSLGIKDISMYQMSGEERAKYIDAMGSDFADSIWRASETFFDKKAYSDLVRKSIDGDQSWVIRNAEGNVTGGALLGHMKDLGFNLNDFPVIVKDTAEHIAA